MGGGKCVFFRLLLFCKWVGVVYFWFEGKGRCVVILGLGRKFLGFYFV